ncbi:unnamed protein product [Parnassius apollo]|uniref:(apollo) hypothetical protein n=1 Tax=Parnassius apollo TaxID=110799 RepID=A0A8S3X840_PARAO|nr:unnamed protein product [Parnassius apollo]
MTTNRQLMPDLEVVEGIDKICNELDKCNLNKNLEITYEENKLNNTDTLNSQKYDLGYSTSKENNTKPVKGIRLKSKTSKKATRPFDRDKNAVTEYNENFSEPDIKTYIKLKDLTDNKTNTPLIRRKRKLYSTEEEKCNDNWTSDCEIVSEAVSNKNFKITCHKEKDNERKEYKQKSRNKKSKKLVLSLHTKKMNDLFDKLKHISNNNEKIILVDKTNDVSIYNFTSDSEEDDFRLSTLKRNNITSGGSVTPVIKDEIKDKANVKRKRNNRPKSIITFEMSTQQLIDELAVDILNTSLEIRKPLESKVNMEPPPKLAIKRKLEAITDDEVKMIENFEGEVPSLHKEKHSNEVKKATLSNDTSEGTESPLPELIIEKMKPHRDDNDSLLSNATKNIKDIYEEIFYTKGCELNITQNLLPDVDKIDDNNERNSCSYMFNITDELNQVSKCLAPASKSSPEKESPIKETEKSNKFMIQKELNKKLSIDTNQNKINSSNEIKNISGNTEIHLEKSIYHTAGSSSMSTKTTVKCKSTKSVNESLENSLENKNDCLGSSSAVHDVIESCQHSNKSTSTKINTSRVAVKRKSATTRDCKKRKVEVKDTQETCDSCSSISSVNDWLKRSVPTTSTAESLDFGLKETTLNVIEKFDSTVDVIHHNTNKKFIKFLVEPQKQLQDLKLSPELKDQRRTQNKQAVTGLLNDIVELIVVKFSALDIRS